MYWGRCARRIKGTDVSGSTLGSFPVWNVDVMAGATVSGLLAQLRERPPASLLVLKVLSL